MATSRSNRLTLLVPLALLAWSGGTAAAAEEAPPEGPKCAFVSATDVTTEAGKQAAVVTAGPLVVSGRGPLVCTIVVNASTHAAYGTAVAANAANGVAWIPPTSLQYNATAADAVVLCTKWVGFPTRYWVGGSLPGTGHWSTNVNDPCGVPLTVAPNYPTCPLWLTIDKYAGTPLAGVWQDCEPYEPIV